MIKRVPCFFWQVLKKTRVYLTHVKGLTQPFICNRFKKMVDAHSGNIGNRNKLHMPSGQQPCNLSYCHPHLLCKLDQIKMRDYKDRRVTPPTREQVFKLCTWSCTMYLHNYIWPTFVILAAFLFPFYYYYFFN